jgi:TatD DNase family protein
MHDTHAHLDIWLQKLGYLDEFSKSPFLSDILLDLENMSTDSLLHTSTLDLFQKQDKSYKKTVQEVLVNHDWLIQPTVSLANFEYVNTLFKYNPKIFYLLGSHPEIVTPEFDLMKYLQELNDFASDFPRTLQPENESLEVENGFSRLVGVGECGLDYHYFSDKNIHLKQQEMFEFQIDLATRLNLPLVIHVREAWVDLLKMLQAKPEIHGKFLIHCFTAGVAELRQVLDLGGLVAFGGVLTFPKTHELHLAAEFCPEGFFVLETDLPFLAPLPHRGKTCDPAMIADTASFLAEIKQINPENIWELSKNNSKKLFIGLN